MTAELSNLLNKIRDARVLVVGDLMLDEFVEGHIDRISPEAPVPILALDRRRYMPGGAANVAANVSALGGKAILIGVVGDDGHGRTLASILEADHAIESNIIQIDNNITTHKARYVAGQHLLRVDNETIRTIPGQFWERIIVMVRTALPHCQAMVLSDYGKGMFNSEKGHDALSSHLIPLATGMRVPVFVDTKSPMLDWFYGADVLKPNLAELAAMSEMPIDTDAEIATAARYLIDANEFETVVVTLGRDGALLVTEKEETRLEGSHRTVCDVSGAGDTFLAAMAVARATGHPMDACGHFASLVAGISVGKVGTAVVTPEEVLATVGQPQAYRVGDPGIAETLAMWRRDNLKIAFTNGVFDLLHVDHIDYLRRCADHGQRLVVGLNSDASVRRQKGEDRPYVPADQRAAMLLALSWVDMVVIFDEDTPEKLVDIIRPDVLVKDSGYHPEEVAGAEILDNWGGRVVIIPRGTRTSTTEIVRRTSSWNSNFPDSNPRGVIQVSPDEPTLSDVLGEALETVEDGHAVSGGELQTDDERQTTAREMMEAEVMHSQKPDTWRDYHARDPYSEAHAWLYSEVMPWWRENAWDKQEIGFFEGWTSVPAGRVAWWGKDKRIMVAARQTAVFSRWSEQKDTSLGVYGWEYILRRQIPPQIATSKFFQHSDGDGRTTLYDQAFVLLACAHRYEKTGPQGCLRLARSIVTFLDAKMAAPEGYYSEITAEGQLVQSPRHQDPHMHLLEAFIALHEATGGQEWLDRAVGIVELARKRFIRDGVLYEEFTADWHPTYEVGALGELHVSPGHHFEWVWLLLEMHERTCDDSYGDLASELYCTAFKWIDQKTGAIPYTVTPQGTVIDARRRLWPQCEALRATHAMIANNMRNPRQNLRDKLLAMILRDHAAGPVWHEWLEADGTPIDRGTVPASSLYHLFFCLDYVLTDMEQGDE